MMASREDTLSMLLLITIIYISLGVYKKSFVNPDGNSVTLGNEDMGKMKRVCSRQCGI